MGRTWRTSMRPGRTWGGEVGEMNILDSLYSVLVATVTGALVEGWTPCQHEVTMPWTLASSEVE